MSRNSKSGRVRPRKARSRRNRSIAERRKLMADDTSVAWHPDELPQQPQPGDDPFEAARREAVQRVFNTAMRYFTGCPNRACRRHRRCAGDPQTCHDMLWPVVPEPVKAWWRAAVEAQHDGLTETQSRRAGDEALGEWRKEAWIAVLKAGSDAPVPPELRAAMQYAEASAKPPGVPRLHRG